MKQMVTRRNRSAGQSLIECALVLPLFTLLILNVVNLGGLFYTWISVANAARTGAQYYTTRGVTIGGLPPVAVSAVETMVVADLNGLPNTTSIQVCVSQSNSATVSCNQGTAPSSAPPAADTPEGTPAVTFLIGAVDVTYTYQPMIPAGDFTALLATTIHQQAKMRVLQ